MVAFYQSRNCRMSSTNMEEKVKEQELGEDTLKDQVVVDGGDVDHSVEELKDSDQNGENSVAMPSPQQEVFQMPVWIQIRVYDLFAI